MLPVLRQANPAELIHALRDTLVQRICNALGIGRLAEFVCIVGIGEERDIGKDKPKPREHRSVCAIRKTADKNASLARFDH